MKVTGYMMINLSTFNDPLGIDVAYVQVIDWIGTKLKDTTQSGTLYHDTYAILFFTIALN